MAKYQIVIEVDINTDTVSSKPREFCDRLITRVFGSANENSDMVRFFLDAWHLKQITKLED